MLHLLRSTMIYRQVSLTDTVGASVFEGLVLCSLDELVGDMVVDPDAAHAKSENPQRVLVVVGQRALADCTDEEGNEGLSSNPSSTCKTAFLKSTRELIWKHIVTQEDGHVHGGCLKQDSQVI